MGQDREDVRPPDGGSSAGERIYEREDMGASAAELEHADGANPTRGDVQAETPLKPHRRAAGDPLNA
ncbi:MAG TPA: hypothetical protein VFQ45_22060 [Longimicrobium sp.]|nr:hypothetical protein [Longimicrobium sp.]